MRAIERGDFVGRRLSYRGASAAKRAYGGRPALDAGLVALAGALGLEAGAAYAIFATGRLAGWTAHVVEQRASAHLIRPRALYVGGEENEGE